MISHIKENQALPPIADMMRNLRRSGWTMGDYTLKKPTGRIAVVSGHNGENVIRTEAETKELAWWRACQQAQSLGMLRG